MTVKTKWEPSIPDKLGCYPTRDLRPGQFRGWAIIFYDEEFDTKHMHVPRRNVHLDVDNLKRVFRDRGFLVKEYKNLAYHGIQQELDAITASKELKEHDCLVVCVLSMRKEGGIYKKDDNFDERKLWSRFYECEALHGKPKLFVIQTSSGMRHDVGPKGEWQHGDQRRESYDTHEEAGLDEDDDDHDHGEYYLPIYPDILVSQARYEVTASAELKEHDCLVVCVLSMRKEGGIHKKDDNFDERKLWSRFYECEALHGKPKLFVIQTSSGMRHDVGPKGDWQHGDQRRESYDTHEEAGLDEDDDDDHDHGEYYLPIYPDILVSQARYEGDVPSKNPDMGSYFIHTLCKVMEKHSETMDVVKMLTMVAQIMAVQFKTKQQHGTYNEKKEMPTVRSTVTKELYLKTQPY
ncbi:unnamed protein product [Darwinula stevensoni]|uniref:Uncharacterized protein n=1 Tax=Darwinula stevensoni TaxID=69355 RepID=A0A7R9FNZ9_9CRUS|nr:unnamed protein product [Darwinula stevensoni]CAG0897309.1 unnamed protein product [Darwinula stevensoni]